MRKIFALVKCLYFYLPHCTLLHDALIMAHNRSDNNRYDGITRNQSNSNLAPSIVVSHSTPNLLTDRDRSNSSPAFRSIQTAINITAQGAESNSANPSINYPKVANFFEALAPTAPPNSSHQEPRFMFYTNYTGPLYGKTLKDIPLSLFDKSVTEIITNEPFWLDVVMPTGEEMMRIKNVTVTVDQGI